MTCPKGHAEITGVEYYGLDPLHYDGISEIHCRTCKKRYGRWSLRELQDNEQEPPYGKSKLRKTSRRE